MDPEAFLDFEAFLVPPPVLFAALEAVCDFEADLLDDLDAADFFPLAFFALERLVAARPC